LLDGLDVHDHCRSGDFGAGIYISGGDDVTIRDCVVHDSAPGAGGNSDGISMGGGAGNISIVGCVAERNADDGIDLWGSDASNPAEVIECIAGRNGYGPDRGVVGDGNGYKLGGASGSGNAYVERCVSYDNASRGFSDNTVGGHTLYNCTSYANAGPGYRMAAGGIEVRNSIAHANGDGAGDFSGADDQYNTWNLGISDPQFRSIDPSDPDFLRLSSDSPAVDAGVDVGLSFSGDSPDLGVYEYTAATTESTASATVKIYIGTGWEQATVKLYDGSEFVSL
jgi:parallel beta-helix repeat protein